MADLNNNEHENDEINEEELDDTPGLDESMLAEIADDDDDTDDDEGFGHITDDDDDEEDDDDEDEEEDDLEEPLEAEDDVEDVDFDTFDDVDEF